MRPMRWLLLPALLALAAPIASADGSNPWSGWNDAWRTTSEAITQTPGSFDEEAQWAGEEGTYWTHWSGRVAQSGAENAQEQGSNWFPWCC